MIECRDQVRMRPRATTCILARLRSSHRLRCAAVPQHFWEHTPGRYVGSVGVRLRGGADEQAVLRRVRTLFEESGMLDPADLTVTLDGQHRSDAPWG